MATHSNILAWKIPWTEEPGRLQSMGSQRVRHNWATDAKDLPAERRFSFHGRPCPSQSHTFAVQTNLKSHPKTTQSALDSTRITLSWQQTVLAYNTPPIPSSNHWKHIHTFLFSLFSLQKFCCGLELNCDHTAAAFQMLPFSCIIITKALNRLSYHNALHWFIFYFCPSYRKTKKSDHALLSPSLLHSVGWIDS